MLKFYFSSGRIFLLHFFEISNIGWSQGRNQGRG